jgi:hypothetical protein
MEPTQDVLNSATQGKILSAGTGDVTHTVVEKTATLFTIRLLSVIRLLVPESHQGQEVGVPQPSM